MTTFALLCRDAEPERQIHIARQAEMLVTAGHTVDIFAPRQLEFPDLPRGSRLQVIVIGTGPPAHSVFRAMVFWLRAFVIITLAQIRRRYHVIQVTGATGPFVMTTWLARRLGARIVIDITATQPERVMAQRGVARLNPHVRLAVFFEELAVDLADHLIAPAEPVRTRLISRGCDAEKVSVVYNAPDERRYNKQLAVARHESVRDRFLIACFGSPDAPLDLETPIAAMRHLYQRVPQALLWVLCPPAARDAVEEQVRQAGVAPYVIIQDRLPDAQLPAFIAQADVSLVAVGRDPLRDMFLPSAIMGSLMLGVTTLSTRTLAMQYYFDARSLITYDQGNAADLAERLGWLWEHADVRQAIANHGREHIAPVMWSHERHRYLTLMTTIAAADTLATLSQGILANRPSISRHRRVPVRNYPSRLASAASLLPEDSQIALGGDEGVPLRISPPSQSWRQRQQLRLRLGAWLLRGTAAALLFSIPIFASFSQPLMKVIAAALFVAVAVVMLILPSGEAAIIVALYFITQRALFIEFPPEGRLGPVLLYLGTALQLIIFIGFGIRAIIQQRPLLRSGFILWPASAYFAVSVISAFVNHVPLNVTVLGIEHTLHNLIFVVLIAEDLPTPQQLRQYVGFVLIVLTAFATISILQTGLAFGLLPTFLHRIPFFTTFTMPAAVIVSDADTYAYLLNFGIFLALGAFISLNISESRYAVEDAVPQRLNIGLLAVLCWLTLAQFLTSSVENWLGLMIGAIALVIILRGTLRFVVLFYLALVLALSFVPLQATPTQPAVTTVSDLRAIGNGTLPHNAPLALSQQVIRDHWLWGVGPGRFGGTVAYLTNSPVYQQYGFPRARSVQSINLFWLHILGETGVLGLLSFLWLFTQATLAIWRSFRRGADQQWWGITAGVFGMALAMASATFFGNALEIDSLSAPFWALVGIAVALPIANRPLIALPLVRFHSDDQETNPSLPSVNGDEHDRAPSLPDRSANGLRGKRSAYDTVPPNGAGPGASR